jgi:hypothetical protein
MLRLKFLAPGGSSTRSVSASAFRLLGGKIETEPKRIEVARHVFRHWISGSGLFAMMECRARVSCVFESAGEIAESHGPFRNITVENRTLFADRKPLAMLFGDGVWKSLITQHSWPCLRIVPEAHANRRRQRSTATHHSPSRFA